MPIGQAKCAPISDRRIKLTHYQDLPKPPNRKGILVLKSRFAVAGACSAVIAGVLGVPSVHAAASLAQTAGPSQIVINNAISKGYESTLTVKLDKPVSASTASRIKSSLEHAIQTSRRTDTGPTGGAFLVCDKVHSFSDSDGTFTIQHACQGNTGPWGYKISTAVCAFTVSNVDEGGMVWTRNGKGEPTQSPHDKPCSYLFHGNFHPELDFDLIDYLDLYTFEVEIGGKTGSAELTIHGSFYSAECSNPSVCK